MCALRSQVPARSCVPANCSTTMGNSNGNPRRRKPLQQGLRSLPAGESQAGGRNSHAQVRRHALAHHHTTPPVLPAPLQDDLDVARNAVVKACHEFLAGTTSMQTVTRAFHNLRRSAAAAAASSIGARVDAAFTLRPPLMQSTTATRLVELHDGTSEELWACMVLDLSSTWPAGLWCSWWLCSVVFDACMVVAGNDLDGEGMVALAPALGKLVALASLDLSCTSLHMRRVGGRGSEN